MAGLLSHVRTLQLSHTLPRVCAHPCARPSPFSPAAKAAVPADNEDDERGAGGLSLQQQQASEAHGGGGGGGGASRWASAADEEDAAAEKEEAERARQVSKRVLSELIA